MEESWNGLDHCHGLLRERSVIEGIQARTSQHHDIRTRIDFKKKVNFKSPLVKNTLGLTNERIGKILHLCVSPDRGPYKAYTLQGYANRRTTLVEDPNIM